MPRVIVSCLLLAAFFAVAASADLTESEEAELLGDFGKFINSIETNARLNPDLEGPIMRMPLDKLETVLRPAIAKGEPVAQARALRYAILLEDDSYSSEAKKLLKSKDESVESMAIQYLISCPDPKLQTTGLAAWAKSDLQVEPWAASSRHLSPDFVKDLYDIVKKGKLGGPRKESAEAWLRRQLEFPPDFDGDLLTEAKKRLKDVEGPSRLHETLLAVANYRQVARLDSEKMGLDYPHEMHFSPDGSRLYLRVGAHEGSEGWVRCVDCDTGDIAWDTEKMPMGSECITLGHDAVYALSLGTVWKFSLSTGETQQKIKVGEAGKVHAPMRAVGRDGRLLLAVDKPLVVVDAEGKVVKEVVASAMNCIIPRVTADGAKFATGTYAAMGSKLQIFDSKSLDVVASASISGAALGWAPGGLIRNNAITLIDPDGGAWVRTLDYEQIFGNTYQPDDSEYYLCNAADFWVSLYSLQTGRQVARFRPDSAMPMKFAAIQDCACAPDGSAVAVFTAPATDLSGKSNVIYIWRRA